MTGRLLVRLAVEPLERVEVDVVVVFVWSDERPLRASAGCADWRLCGRLSELVGQGRLAGVAGEAALLPSTGGLRSPLVLVLGLGARPGFDASRSRSAAREAVERALALRAGAVALPLVDVPSAELDLATRVDALVQGALEARGESDLDLHVVASPEERPAVAECLREHRAHGEARFELAPAPSPRRGPRPPRGTPAGQNSSQPVK